MAMQCCGKCLKFSAEGKSVCDFCGVPLVDATRKPCPKCRGANKAEATRCSWCGEALSTGPGAPAVPAPIEVKTETKAELEELRRWMKTAADEPLPFPIHWSTIVLWSVALAIFAIAYGTLPVNFRLYAAAGLGAMAAIWAVVYLVRDLRQVAVRARRTPDELAQWFGRCVAGGGAAIARLAVASYPRAARRAEEMEGAWQEILEGTVSLRRWRSSALSAGFASVSFTLEMSTHNKAAMVAFGAVGMLATTRRAEVTIEKLAVLRGKRWYVVDGHPGARVDQELKTALAKGQ